MGQSAASWKVDASLAGGYGSLQEYPILAKPWISPPLISQSVLIFSRAVNRVRQRMATAVQTEPVARAVFMVSILFDG